MRLPFVITAAPSFPKRILLDQPSEERLFRNPINGAEREQMFRLRCPHFPGVFEQLQANVGIRQSGTELDEGGTRFRSALKTIGNGNQWPAIIGYARIATKLGRHLRVEIEL